MKIDELLKVAGKPVRYEIGGHQGDGILEQNQGTGTWTISSDPVFTLDLDILESICLQIDGPTTTLYYQLHSVNPQMQQKEG